MAQRNTLRLDTSGFAEMIRKLDALGGNVRQAVTDALEQSAETIREDTLDALDNAYLPAGGRYSMGDTKESVVDDKHVRWEGLVGWVPVGFDFSKIGAGGYLITGTPKMQPDYRLNQMYKQKKYMSQIQRDIGNVIMDYVVEEMEK